MAPESPERACDTEKPAGAWDQLEDVFAEPLARMHKWRQDSVQATHAELQRAMRELLRERSCLEDLEADLENAAQEKENAFKLKADSEKVAELVRRSNAAAAARAKGVLRTKEAVAKAHDECRQRLAQEEDALESGRLSAEAHRAEVDGLLRLYSDHLGLVIAREAPKTARMTFTLLDPAEPTREFSFSLGLDEASEYRVVGCDPELPDLGERVARLNEEGDSKVALTAFVCGMRRAFQSTLGDKW